MMRLIMNDGFRFDSVNRLFRVISGVMGKSLVSAARSWKNVTTKITHAHEQRESMFDAYLVAAGLKGALQRRMNRYG